MFRKFITKVVAAAIIVTAAGSVPAQASDRDLARALALVAGVAIVSTVISDHRHEPKKVTRTRSVAPKQGYVRKAQRYQPRQLPRRAYRQRAWR